MRDHDDSPESRADPTQATRDWIDLKLASFRSEMRLLFVLSVAGNQVLSHLSIAPALTALGTGGVVAGALVKTFVIGR